MSLRLALIAGKSGVLTAGAKIAQISTDTANASDPTYARRRIDTSAAHAVRTGGVLIGSGVRTDSVVRIADNLVTQRLIGARGDSAAATTRHEALAPIDSFLGTSGSDLRSAVDGFFDGLRRAKLDPSDQGLRQQAGARTVALTRAVRQLASQLAQSRADVKSRTSGAVLRANSLLAEAARLNTEISASGGSGSELLDRRDAVLSDLADLAGATADIHADGTATVLIGGHAAVEGGDARRMASSTSVAGTSITLSADRGTIDLSTVIGGELGGNASADATLVGWKSNLDVFAKDLVSTFNAVHMTGFGADGVGGRPLFAATVGDEAATIELDPSITSSDALGFSGTAGSAGDGTTLDALVALQGTALPGGASPGETATAIADEIGFSVYSAATDREAAASRSDDLTATWQKLSGVDLDEVAADLIEHQNAWQAAARVIKVTDTLLGELMTLR